MIASQPVVDCDELMEERAVIFNSMNKILAAVEKNKSTITEDQKIQSLELIDKLLKTEDKLAIEWKSNCS